MFRRTRRAISACLRGYLIFPVIMMVPACRTANIAKPAAPTRVDYLILKYDELRTGRFAILADFEDPAHRQLAQVIGVSPHASCMIQESVGPHQPGENALAFLFGSRDDTLALSNEQATDWYLRRDWRTYDLLMFAVESPQSGLTLNLTLAAGQPGSRNQVHSSFPLESGANTLRIDLAELSEKIPLDDVRAILLSVSGATAPSRVLLDDFLLAGNSVDLLGDSTRTDGRLYVRRSGLRHKVGSGGRFEVTFANGQIVEYFDLASDPSKLNNLVRGTTLGPAPFIDSEDSAAESSRQSLRAFGSHLTTSQRLLEMSDVRVVIECEWRFTDDPRTPPEARPSYHWRYAIYPTGQAYVSLTATTRLGSWSVPGLSWVVALTPPPDAAVLTIDPRVDSRSVPLTQPTCAVLTAADGRTPFVFIPGPTFQPNTMIISREPDSGRQTIRAPMEGPLADVTRASALFYLAPWPASTRFRASLTEVQSQPGAAEPTHGQATDTSSRNLACAQARAFVDPPQPRLELGRFRRPVDQPAELGPFDRALGQYTVAPDRGRVRLVFENRETPTFAPAIEILDSAGQEAWVYVNHVILKSVARNAAGNILFQLPADLPRRTIVEALLRPAETSRNQ